jgi:hypothetical protein
MLDSVSDEDKVEGELRFFREVFLFGERRFNHERVGDFRV